MSALRPLLAAFYERYQPLGVAFVGSAKYGVKFGSLPYDAQGLCGGFTQLHDADHSVSVYASYFGWGKFLIAQFEFQNDDLPPGRPWLAFVRLAAAVQRYLDEPGEPTAADAPALVPLAPRPRILRGEA